MFQKRTSYVNQIKLNTAVSSSVFEIGDSAYIRSYTRALAVQREKELFFGNEGNLEDDELFSQAIPFEPLVEKIRYRSTPITPFIKVNNIDVTAVSTSSILHIGNSKKIYMEARIKHIRQLLGDKENDHRRPSI